MSNDHGFTVLLAGDLRIKGTSQFSYRWRLSFWLPSYCVIKDPILKMSKVPAVSSYEDTNSIMKVSHSWCKLTLFTKHYHFKGHGKHTSHNRQQVRITRILPIIYQGEFRDCPFSFMIIIWFSQSLSSSTAHLFYNWVVLFAMHVPLHYVIPYLLKKIWAYSYFGLKKALNISLSPYPSPFLCHHM